MDGANDAGVPVLWHLFFVPNLDYKFVEIVIESSTSFFQEFGGDTIGAALLLFFKLWIASSTSALVGGGTLSAFWNVVILSGELRSGGVTAAATCRHHLADC